MSIKGEYNGIKKALFDKYFGFLNPRQREAVYTTEGPLLVLAGAGSGKTTVIVNRIANLILFGRASCDATVPENEEELLPLMKAALLSSKPEVVRAVLQRCAVDPAPPYRVLCITFTNKAAREFKERLSNTLGEQAGDIWAGTFHSICVRILRRHIDLLGYNNDFTIYDTDDSKKLVNEVLKELNISDSVLPVRMVLGSISRAKENGRTPEDEMADAGKDFRLQKLCRVYEHYQSKLKSANALDFDDIIMLANRLFEQHQDVRDKYRRHFRYILVDEYQDTNPSQSRLIALLAGDDNNVCVVGDDDQSIYSFRGATVDNILGFDNEYKNARVIRLEQNYRSTGNILAAANGIISNNVDRKGKELWTESDDGEKVHIRRVYTQAEEAQFVCDTVADRVKKGAKYSDFAVLYRVNALSNSLETAFVKNKIPYKIFGGIRFYERREIKDILAYLSVIANPTDSVRLRRIINLPKRGIGDTTVDRAFALADQNNVDVFSIIENASRFTELQRASAKLVRFASLINSLREYANDHSLADTVSYVIEATGYRLMLAEEDDGQEREENILELVSSAALFAETSENPTLSEFLNELSLVSDLDGYAEETDAVVLMTVHSAKGLEFPTVFIAGFEEGMFPSAQSISEGTRGLEEERRLAYVAVTRAKNELFLLTTESRMLYGRTELRTISRFGDEIPSKVCDRTNQRSSRPSNPYSQPSHSEQDRQSRNSFMRNMRQETAKSAPAEMFDEGCTVLHPMFGEGEVLKATPMGGDVLYEIEFKNCGVKRLMGNYAKLKKV